MDYRSEGGVFNKYTLIVVLSDEIPHRWYVGKGYFLSLENTKLSELLALVILLVIGSIDL